MRTLRFYGKNPSSNEVVSSVVSSVLNAVSVVNPVPLNQGFTINQSLVVKFKSLA